MLLSTRADITPAISVVAFHELTRTDASCDAEKASQLRSEHCSVCPSRTATNNKIQPSACIVPTTVSSPSFPGLTELSSFHRLPILPSLIHQLFQPVCLLMKLPPVSKPLPTTKFGNPRLVPDTAGGRSFISLRHPSTFVMRSSCARTFSPTSP